METRQVTCDACGADLTTTGNSVDYRLALKSERLPLAGNTCTDMGISPPIEQDAHFCSLGCLSKWVTKTFAPLSEFRRMKIIGEEFPLALVQSVVIAKIDSVCLAIERAHGIGCPETQADAKT